MRVLVCGCKCRIVCFHFEYVCLNIHKDFVHGCFFVFMYLHVHECVCLDILVCVCVCVCVSMEETREHIETLCLSAICTVLSKLLTEIILTDLNVSQKIMTKNSIQSWRSIASPCPVIPFSPCSIQGFYILYDVSI